MSRAPGRFLVLEGIDGAGTTTQVAQLAAALKTAEATRATAVRAK